MSHMVVIRDYFIQSKERKTHRFLENLIGYCIENKKVISKDKVHLLCIK